MKQITITFILIILTLGFLKGQNISDFDNIILENSFEGSNLHQVLLDVNASKSVFIAYDVQSASEITIDENYQNKSLATLLKDVVKSDLKKVGETKYLIRFGKKDIPKTKDTYTIKGKIFDYKKQPIPYALIYINPTNAVYADKFGAFNIQVKQLKNQIICASMLGFDSKCEKINKDKVNNYIFVLITKPIELDEILLSKSTIKAKIKEGNFEIQMNTFLKQNAIGGDIIRSIKILPSIHSNNDVNAEIQFRNTYVEENLVQYEDIPLYMTTHMYGFFSSINNLAVDKISVFTNNVPVEYVSRTGGMVLLENEGRENYFDVPKWEFNIDLDFLSAKGSIRYQDKKNSFKLSSRTSFGGISNQNFYSLASQEAFSVLDKDGISRTITPLNPSFKFNDHTLYYKIQFNPVWSLKLSGIHIEDSNAYILENNRVIITPKKDTVTVIQKHNEVEKSFQNGIGLALKARWNKKWTSSFLVNFSTYSATNTNIFSAARIKQNKFKTLETFNYENAITSHRFQFSQNYTPNAKHTWLFGLNVEQYRTSIDYKFDGFNKRPTIHELSDDRDLSAFSSWKYNISDQFSILSSAKTTYNSKLKSQYFSPRIQLQYSPSKLWTFSLNAQSNYQTLRKIYHENPYGKPQSFWSGVNDKNIKALTSKSISLDSNFQSEGWVFTSSVYYRLSNGITEWLNILPAYRKRKDNRDLGPELRFHTGKGKGYGLETMLYKRTGNFQSWISYRLSRSLVSFPKLYRRFWVPSSDDQLHHLQITSNYKLQNWHFETAYQFGSGRRYLDISTLLATKVRTELNFSDFSNLPNYHRLDFSISHEWENVIEKSNWILTASVFNVLDRNNSYYRQYPLLLPEIGGDQRAELTGTDFNQIGRFWDLRLEIGF